MKRLVALVVMSVLFLSGLFTGFGPVSVEGSPKNNQAVFIANRFVKIGFDRDGLPLYPSRMFPWQKTQDIQVWGREGYPMPHAYVAQHQGANIPAVEKVSDVVPVLWTDFYLTMQPEGGQSSETDHWYAVLDSAGQLWMDPDGIFHDPRYNAYSDPRSEYYMSGSCNTVATKLNGFSRYCVDPVTNNNTQGPYILNPKHKMFKEGQSITFEVKNTLAGDRKFQIGYVDMVDYPPERIISKDNDPLYAGKMNDEHAVKFFPTEVLPYQWDIGLPLVNFRTQFTWEENAQFPNSVFQGDEMFHEYHARARQGGNITISIGARGLSSFGTYDPYEYIYRKGPGNLDLRDQLLTAPTPWFTAPQPIVQVGDVRLSDISIKSWDGSTVFNYPANSVVRSGDADAPQDYDHNGLLEADEYKSLYFFKPTMKHTETLYDGRNLSDLSDISNIYYDIEQRSDLGYTISEWIYNDKDFDLANGENPNGDNQVSPTNETDSRVQPDTRFSPVNTKMALARPFSVTLRSEERRVGKEC